MIRKSREESKGPHRYISQVRSFRGVKVNFLRHGSRVYSPKNPCRGVGMVYLASISTGELGRDPRVGPPESVRDGLSRKARIEDGIPHQI
jgi:hypothetical protein